LAHRKSDTAKQHTRNRAFRGRQTDEEDEMSQISLTFPDGNVRDYPAGVTAAEVAASIAPSLANGGHFRQAGRRAL